MGGGERNSRKLRTGAGHCRQNTQAKCYRQGDWGVCPGKTGRKKSPNSHGDDRWGGSRGRILVRRTEIVLRVEWPRSPFPLGEARNGFHLRIRKLMGC